MDPDLIITSLAASQHGVFTTAQALAAGLRPKQVAYRLATGRWERRFQRALRVAGTPVTWKGELLAACWAGGTRAVASHRSAATLWGFPGAKQHLEITCPRWRRARHSEIVVHEIKNLDRADLTVVDAIPVTSAELTLMHLAAVASPSLVEMAYEQARNSGIVSWHSCDSLLARYARRGRNGVAILRTVINRRDASQPATESPMETLVLQILRHFGMPDPTTQHVVTGPDGSLLARVDLAYPSARVAIEYQSAAHHSTELDRMRDNRRRNRLRALGWETIEARQDVRSDPSPFIRAVQAALRRPAHRSGVSSSPMPG